VRCGTVPPCPTRRVRTRACLPRGLRRAVRAYMLSIGYPDGIWRGCLSRTRHPSP